MDPSSRTDRLEYVISAFTLRLSCIVLLAGGCLVALTPGALAATPTVDDSGSATTTLVGGSYRFDAGLLASCPTSITTGCSVKTTVTALVHPATGMPKVVQVAAGTATIASGGTARVVARVNAAGTRELKVRGSLRGRVRIEASGIGPASAATEARYAGEQKITIPPLVVGASTTLKAVKLAPGQRLHLRLDGENTGTGYAWVLDKLAAKSALKLVSSTSTKDPNCTAGTVGCFSLRNYVFAPLRAGRTTISTGLYGPTPETDATVRIDLAVTSVAVPPAVKVATFADNGKTVRLLPGQDLVVQLDGESGSTGFSWTPKKLAMNASLALAASSVYDETCAPIMPGCPSTREFTYVTRRAGTSILDIGLFGPASTVASKRLRVAVVSR